MQYLKRAEATDEGLNFREGVASAAVATELGEYFQYVLAQPVSLPRQKSALLPIVNQEVTGSSKVSIYNESVHAKFPLLGLRFKNSTGLHLCQGPITVFEDDAYAGDARIADLQPGETRLLSYAMDLGTEVEPQQKDTDTLASRQAGQRHPLRHLPAAGEQDLHRQEPLHAGRARCLLEHPFRSQFKLVSPEKPAERTRDVYRFEMQGGARQAGPLPGGGGAAPRGAGLPEQQQRRAGAGLHSLDGCQRAGQAGACSRRWS